MKNIFLSVIAVSLTMTAFAEETQMQQEAPMPAQMDPNPSARWGTKDRSNFFIQGEVLWIKPLGMNFSKTLRTNNHLSSASYFSNEFTTGERVGIGYNTCYDGWDAVLEYTGFNYHHNNAGSAYRGGNVTGTTAYTYYFNQGDLDFGRMMKISRKVKMRPHVGARVLWLNEKVSFNYTVPTGYSYQKNKNTLGGLELGLDSVWMFAKEFGVYANLGLTTLVNQQKSVFFNNASANIDGPSFNTNYGSKIVSGYDIKVGIRWDKNFSDDSYHFGINFGYEQHSLININNLLGDFSDSVNHTLFDNDFTWQAISLGARFDF